MGVRHDDEGEVAEGLDAVCEAGGEDVEGEVCGLEELRGCERRAAMSRGCQWRGAVKQGEYTDFTRSVRVSGWRGRLARREISWSVTVAVESCR